MIFQDVAGRSGVELGSAQLGAWRLVIISQERQRRLTHGCWWIRANFSTMSSMGVLVLPLLYFLSNFTALFEVMFQFPGNLSISAVAGASLQIVNSHLFSVYVLLTKSRIL